MFSQILNCSETSNSAFAHSYSHLESATRAVASSKESWNSCLEILIKHELSSIERSASFQSQIRCIRTTHSHKHAVKIGFTKHSHILFTIKECIANSAITHAVAFHFGHSWERGLLAGRACCHHANLSAIRTIQARRDKPKTVKHEVRYLIVHDLRTKSNCLFLTDFGKFSPRERFFKTKIIFNFVGLNN